MNQLRLYRRGDRSLQARAAYAEYCRERYLARAKGETNLVSIKRAKQLLLTFESSLDASRVTGVSQPTIHRILTGKVKQIRKSTEERILKAA